MGTKIHPNRSGGLPKSDHFFDCLWVRVLLPLGPNLVPTWPPKPSQNRSKLRGKLIKKSIIWPLAAKLAEINNMLKTYYVFNDFGCLGLPTWHPKPTKIRSKSLPKSIKQGIENMMRDGFVFGPLLARISMDLAAKLEAKLDPRCHQNLKNWVSEKSLKNHQKKVLRRTPPGFLLAPKKSLRDL